MIKNGPLRYNNHYYMLSYNDILTNRDRPVRDEGRDIGIGNRRQVLGDR